MTYFSKAFSGHKLSKPAYEKELMVLAIENWWRYLMGWILLVYSDQKSLKHLLQ
jgi:hypothetical protein